MSGGYFDYMQNNIDNVVDAIERVLANQGKEKPKNELFARREYYEQYPEDMYYPVYSHKVQEKMRDAIKYLKIAAIYTRRIDWFLSGDDEEESFISRLEKELNDKKQK